MKLVILSATLMLLSATCEGTEQTLGSKVRSAINLYPLSTSFTPVSEFLSSTLDDAMGSFIPMLEVCTTVYQETFQLTKGDLAKVNKLMKVVNSTVKKIFYAATNLTYNIAQSYDNAVQQQLKGAFAAIEVLPEVLDIGLQLPNQGQLIQNVTETIQTLLRSVAYQANLEAWNALYATETVLTGAKNDIAQQFMNVGFQTIGLNNSAAQQIDYTFQGCFSSLTGAFSSTTWTTYYQVPTTLCYSITNLITSIVNVLNGAHP